MAISSLRAKSWSARRDQIVLTPELFRNLDSHARRSAGCPIEVFAAESRPGLAGLYSHFATLVYKDSRVKTGQCMQERCVIKIANRIDVGEFWSWSESRPEIDSTQIPAEKIYEFVLWHEIGHRIQDLRFWDAAPATHIPTFGDDDFWWVNELRADRFAWAAVFPRHLLPRNQQAPEARAITRRIRLMKRSFPRPAFQPRPLADDGFSMVPRTHVEGGIPWSLN